MNKPILVIMAAGLGSRFGGLKQVMPLDEAGHLMIDFALYDARRAGFEKAVIIVKPENEETFEEAIGRRVRPFMDIRYARQSIDMLPSGFSVPEGRTKPWGTAHAVLCAKDYIDAPFAVINADDFYGREAYQVLYDFLSQPRGAGEHAMVSYRIENTLTDHGSVSRGVCQVSEEGDLTGIQERTKIIPRDGGAAYTEDGEHYVFVPAGTVVSLNFWGFQQEILREFEARFPAFLREGLKANPMKCEYFLPSIPDALIREGKGRVRVLTTNARWYGMTYREDMDIVKQAISEMKAEGIYPENLWA